MTLSAVILLLLPQDVRRVEFREDFERPGPHPYDGWEQVADALHPGYNKAERYRWIEEHRLTLDDEKGSVVAGAIVRRTDDALFVRTERDVVEVPSRLILKDEIDETRRPRQGDHAASIRCYRGAGAFRTRRGFLGSVQHPMPVGVDYTYPLSASVKFARPGLNHASIALRWLDVIGE